MQWRWLLLPLLAWGAWNYWHGRPVVHQPGILVAGEPVQTAVDAGVGGLAKAGYQITPLESFSVEARVLAKARYRFDRGADLSPVDLAMGWGPMSDQAVLDRIDISQNERFYYWRTKDFPIPRRDIETHSANMHMIPASSEVEHQLLDLRPGQVVTLAGYLVEVRGTDGWRWRSSLTREDTGAGACELIWVEKVEAR